MVMIFDVSLTWYMLSQTWFYPRFAFEVVMTVGWCYRCFLEYSYPCAMKREINRSFSHLSLLCSVLEIISLPQCSSGDSLAIGKSVNPHVETALQSCQKERHVNCVSTCIMLLWLWIWASRSKPQWIFSVTGSLMGMHIFLTIQWGSFGKLIFYLNWLSLLSFPVF